MNIEEIKQPANYVKAKKGQDLEIKKKNNFKAFSALFGLLIFIGGAVAIFLITQKQDTTPVAPTAPQSQPAAYIEQTQTCTIEFDVKAEEEPNLINCGKTGCKLDSDCEGDYVCVSTSETDENGDIVKYCANEDYVDACADDPSESTCCEAAITTTPTATPTATLTTTPTTTVTTTPTTTVTPITTVTPTTTTTSTTTTTPNSSVTTVITTVGCNESCSANADCTNISHICYNGQCRLDVNPTDSQCKLPSGETTITRPVKVPTQSGVADWANYLKAGLGTLGIGALLLLLL